MQQQYRQDQSFVFSQLMAQRLSILGMGQAKLELLIEHVARTNPMIRPALPPLAPLRGRGILISPEEIGEQWAQEKRLYDTVKEDLLLDWQEGDGDLLYLILGSLDEFGFLGMDGAGLCKDSPFDPKRTEELRQSILRGSVPGLAAKGAKEYYIYAAEALYGKGSPAHRAALLLEGISKKISPAEAAAALGWTSAQAAEAFDQLKKLPSSPLGRETSAVLPDFLIEAEGGELRVSLTRSLKPGVLIPEGQYSSEELLGFRREAQALIEAVAAREDALLRHAEALILARSDYFMKDAPPSVVGLKEIALITGRHPSTVSRALRGRYFIFEGSVTPFSTLWSHNVGGKSHRQIERCLRTVIESEDKAAPLSDGDIREVLSKHGFDIARRTVAKYREKLGIPGMYERKQNQGGTL